MLGLTGEWFLLLPTDLEVIDCSLSAPQWATKPGNPVAAVAVATVAVVLGAQAGLCGWAPVLHASSLLRNTPRGLSVGPLPLPWPSSLTPTAVRAQPAKSPRVIWNSPPSVGGKDMEVQSAGWEGSSQEATL